MTVRQRHTQRRTARRAAGVLLGALALAAPLCAGAEAATAAPTPPPAHNLIRNGSFARPQVPNAVPSWWGGSYAQYYMQAWQPVAPGGYDLLNAKFAQHDGDQAVDLGQGYAANGGIKQSINTDPGTAYTLTFEHSPDAWAACKRQATDFSVRVLDEESGTEIARQHFQAATADGGPHWKRAKMTFVAAGDDTTIAFHGNSTLSCQAAITDVRVPKVSNAGG